MLYVAYQMHTDIMVPVRTWAGMVANSGGSPLLADHPAMRNLTAVYELIARAGRCRPSTRGCPNATT